EEVQAGITYYYRLKQVDIDGTVEYSDIRSARLNSEEKEWRIYPNPIGLEADLNVKLFLTEPSSELYLMDVEGRMIRTITVEVSSIGWNVIEVSVSDLAAGTYFIANPKGQVQEFIKSE
ncbi:MAG: T9SS type A sorting domain-containing protein, partial [Bacteroidota bacterium]